MTTLTIPTEPNDRARFYSTALRLSEPQILITRGMNGFYSLTFKWKDPNGSAKATIFGVHADVIQAVLLEHGKLKTMTASAVKGSEANL